MVARLGNWEGEGVTGAVAGFGWSQQGGHPGLVHHSGGREGLEGLEGLEVGVQPGAEMSRATASSGFQPSPALPPDSKPRRSAGFSRP